MEATNRNNILLLIGPSASGKSTFVRMLYRQESSMPGFLVENKALLETIGSWAKTAPSYDIKYPDRVLTTSMVDGVEYSDNNAIVHIALNKKALNRKDEITRELVQHYAADNSNLFAAVFHVSPRRLMLDWLARDIRTGGWKRLINLPRLLLIFREMTSRKLRNKRNQFVDELLADLQASSTGDMLITHVERR